MGSHVLDLLCARRIPTAILLRSTSSHSFIQPRLAEVDVRSGSITEPATLAPALAGVTHVIHCAGCTRARTLNDFHDINHLGTRKVVEALNALPEPRPRLIHISSLAATGPAPAEKPARENDPPHPVSEYGRTKLAGELEVRDRYRGPFTIIRPPAVYGPRDNGFLSVFQTVKLHLRPRTSERQAISLVFVKDLAEAIVATLDQPATIGRTYFVTGREPTTVGRMAIEIARQMAVWTLPFPLLPVMLWPACAINDLIARVTGRARLLNFQKYAELRAPGWVCDPARWEREAGPACATTLPAGISATLGWYREAAWL